MNAELTKIDNYLNNGYAQKIDDIKIGDETKMLLKCRAMISDAGSGVNDILFQKYGNSYEDFIKRFQELQADLDTELCSLIGSVIEVNAVETGYKEI